MTFNQRMRAFWQDDCGAITIDWVGLTAGILILGIAVVYAIFSNGVTSVTGRITGGLSSVQMNETGEAPSFVETLADELAPLWSFLDGAVNIAGDVANAVITGHDVAMELDSGTVSMSFTTGGSMAGQQTLFSKDSSGLDNGGHLTIRSDDGDLWVRLQDTNGSHYINVGNQFEANTTYNVDVSFGSNGMQAFVNDTNVGSNSFDGGIAFNHEPVAVGANTWTSGDGVANNLSHAFGGTINSVDLYDTEISPGA